MLPATITEQAHRLRPQPLPDCAICNDLKFVIPVANGVSGRAVPCRCYEKVLAAQRQQVLLQNGKLPPAIQQMTLQNFVAANRKQSVAQAGCQEFAHNPQGWL
ncbi:MAG: hypothetical protein GY805_39955, partial [Chloroflexi bacterium]|nr:hypothetical protein [Chloroflexota bacterium]